METVRSSPLPVSFFSLHFHTAFRLRLFCMFFCLESLIPCRCSPGVILDSYILSLFLDLPITSAFNYCSYTGPKFLSHTQTSFLNIGSPALVSSLMVSSIWMAPKTSKPTHPKLKLTLPQQQKKSLPPSEFSISVSVYALQCIHLLKPDSGRLSLYPL